MTITSATLTTQINNSILAHCDPHMVKLPDIAYDELVDLDKHSDPTENALPQPNDEKMADLDRCGYESPTLNEPLLCYGEHVRYESSRYSMTPRIDNVTIPLHLTRLIKRDAFDLGERQGRKAAVDVGENDHSQFKDKYHELTDYYNTQNVGHGKVEAVLYRRKRKADNTDLQVTNKKSKMDARGRMIEQTVWSSRLSQPLTHRSLIPVREAVFQQASDYQPSPVMYQRLPSTPILAPVEAEYHRTALFRSKDRAFRNPKITSSTRRKALAASKAAVAADQSELRKDRGGLIIDLGNRLRTIHGADPGHSANGDGEAYDKADSVTEEYAYAFEDWDDRLQEAFGRAYAKDESRRVWVRTMWESPEDEEESDGGASVCSDEGVDKSEDRGEWWWE